MPEKRVVLRNCGVIDPDDISSYLERDGFKALEKVLGKMNEDGVIEEIKSSGLKGRGGAGFPCGLKWELARKTESDQKYLICNADEGEVGTFKDRYIMENDPFSLIEGIAIAGYAIGARKSYIYLREEYHFLLNRLKGAVEQAADRGFLKHVEIEIVEGAGAYVCGEESALMESIEGKRGESRYRPPFPPVKGLFDRPTIINNVETLMNIPGIILNGSKWFKGIGTEGSEGTKVFSLSGDVENPGIFELELGSTLRELVESFGKAKGIKAVQVGGASGRIFPSGMLDTPLSYSTALGSGSVTVFDESRDMIDMVYQTTCFFAEESCGKCTPCREGLEVMVEILGRIMSGDGLSGDLKVLEDLSETMKLSSLCGLGQSSPNMLLDTLKYFGNEFENRIKQADILRMIR